MHDKKEFEQTVSVCLATYNGEKYIAAQLKSILDQLPDTAEVIISDDGSKDRTIEIVRSFNDPRVFIKKNTGKSGPIGNFENALSFAKGDIIFLSDQDDVWMPNKLADHMKGHQVHDLVISDAVVVDETGNILFDSFFIQRKSRAGLFNNLLKNSYIGCCMSFKRRILQISLPFPASIHMHDWWIGLIAERFGTVMFLNSKTLRYLRHDNNASQTLVKKLPVKDQIKNRVNLLYNLFTLKN